MTPKLYGIRYSPWSIRARWALAHHGIDYTYEEYIPMISTPKLRVKLRDVRGKVTVPILFPPEGSAIRDSTEIARWADEQGRGDSLFDDEEAVRTWVTVAEDIASSGRALTTYAAIADPVARKQQIPSFVPRPVRPLAGPLVDFGAKYLAGKYGFDESHGERAARTIRAALEQVGNRLAASEYLGDGYGWSDIAVATALQFVDPDDRLFRFRAESRAAWSRPELVDDFSDVLTWRDRLVTERWAG